MNNYGGKKAELRHQ